MTAAQPVRSTRAATRPPNWPVKHSPAALAKDVSTRDALAPFPEHWRGERGAAVNQRCLRVRITGPDEASPVLVLGGVSAGRNAAATGVDDASERPWWPEIVRTGGAIDIARRKIVTIDFFPEAPSEFVELTTADYADVIAYALPAIGIDRLAAVIGASFGGMVALRLAERHPRFANRLLAISAAHFSSPMARGWRRAQRRILELGLATGRLNDATAIARELAITTYRTPEEFSARFPEGAGIDSYLERHGKTYTEKMTAARYLTLCAAIDNHRVEPERIQIPTSFVAADSDRLVPLEDIKDLASRVAGPANLDVISSQFGHDAFLKETAALTPIITRFLEEAAR